MGWQEWNWYQWWMFAEGFLIGALIPVIAGYLLYVFLFREDD